MVRVIQRLRLRNYRAFSDCVIDLPNPTFLVGKNGAGKTSLLDSLQLIADCSTMPLATALQRRGGISSVRLRKPGSGKARRVSVIVEVRPPGFDGVGFKYGFELEPAPNKGVSVHRELCQKFSLEGGAWQAETSYERVRDHATFSSAGGSPALDQDRLALPHLLGMKEFSLLGAALGGISLIDPQPQSIREPQEPSPSVRLDRWSKNIASILSDLIERDTRRADRLNDFLEKVAVQTRFVKPKQVGSSLSVQFVQAIQGGKLPFDAASMSDGTLRALGILAAVFQRHRPSVLAVEEPEASIHPGALAVVLDALEVAADFSHVIISTQSPEALDSRLAGPDSIRVVQWRDGFSSVLPASKEAQSAIAGHLFGAGELLKANQLSPDDSAKEDQRLFGEDPW